MPKAKKRTLLKVVAIAMLVIIVALTGLIIYVKTAMPDIGPAPKIKIAGTKEQVERGRYLATSVNSCMDCHSKRDWSRYAGPLVAGTIGQGGERFDQTYGFPGVYYSRNITPAGIGRYTDGELFRAITAGVSKEGRPLFPIMPYEYYGRMDSTDIVCIIAYLRTLSPIRNVIPESVSDFPMNIIINTIPKAPTFTRRPDTSMHEFYGAYLVNAAGCIECHTPAKQGQIITELAYTGGREFLLPGGGVARSANITPDMETGIGNWSVNAFVNRFKMYADSTYHAPPVAKGGMNTIMPWSMYGHMTREDLAAIYDYLRSLQPVNKAVVRFSPPIAEN